MKLGDKVIYCNDLSDPRAMRRGTLERISKEGSFRVFHISGTPVYEAQCWPLSADAELTAILVERERLKKQFDDSIRLIYELQAKLAREA